MFTNNILYNTNTPTVARVFWDLLPDILLGFLVAILGPK